MWVTEPPGLHVFYFHDTHNQAVSECSLALPTVGELNEPFLRTIGISLRTSVSLVAVKLYFWKLKAGALITNMQSEESHMSCLSVHEFM